MYSSLLDGIFRIRMIDHHEFFWRAAGQIVCVQDPRSFAYHCHNWFDWRYRPFREDTAGDAAYIRAKHARGRGGAAAAKRERSQIEHLQA